LVALNTAQILLLIALATILFISSERFFVKLFTISSIQFNSIAKADLIVTGCDNDGSNSSSNNAINNNVFMGPLTIINPTFDILFGIESLYPYGLVVFFKYIFYT
jgi:hypothetical protein